MQVFLDNASTTKVSEGVAASVGRMMTEDYGNPSSSHTMGQAAESSVNEARGRVAALLGAEQGQIVFCGCGTEANNLAIHSVFKNPARIAGQELIISAVEHPAVAEPARALEALGAVVKRVRVDSAGIIDLDELNSALSDRTAMVSVMHVNNEIGGIQPLGEIGRAVSDCAKRSGRQIILHSDCIQSCGKLEIAGAGFMKYFDMISISGHKLHGPKGIGALCATNPGKLAPILFGGGQEGGVRSGTENSPGIVGLGTAAAEAMGSGGVVGHARSAMNLRSRLLAGIRENIPGAVIVSPEEASAEGIPGYCSPWILAVSFPGARGEVLLHALEDKGVYVSTGSACASHGKHSTLGSALGLSEAVETGMLRFSFGRFNTVDEIDYALKGLIEVVARYGKF